MLLWRYYCPSSDNLNAERRFTDRYISLEHIFKTFRCEGAFTKFSYFQINDDNSLKQISFSAEECIDARYTLTFLLSPIQVLFAKSIVS